VKTLADARRILDRTAHSAGAILVDALHMQRSGATPADVAAVPPALLPYAQLCDGPFEPVRPVEEVALTEARTGRHFPGDGGFPLRELVEALPADAALAIEAPVAELADKPPDEVARLAFTSMSRLLEPPKC
jgi:sugar phosphate isomerase/epimerase